jgi:hypothetical protein
MITRKIWILSVAVGLFVPCSLLGQQQSVPSTKGPATSANEGKALPSIKREVFRQLSQEMHFSSKPKPTSALELISFYTDASNFHSNQAVKLALQLGKAAEPHLKESLKYRFSEESMRWQSDLEILKMAREWSAKPTASNYFTGLIRTAQNKLTQDMAAPRAAQAKLERENKAAMLQAEAERKWQEQRAQVQKIIKREKLCNDLFDGCGNFFAFPFPFFLACGGIWIALLLQKKHAGAQLVLNGLGVAMVGGCVIVDIHQNGFLSFNGPHHTVGVASFLVGVMVLFLTLHAWAYWDKPKSNAVAISPWKKSACLLLSGVTAAWLLLILTNPDKASLIVQHLIGLFFMAANGRFLAF